LVSNTLYNKFFKNKLDFMAYLRRGVIYALFELMIVLTLFGFEYFYIGNFFKK